MERTDRHAIPLGLFTHTVFICAVPIFLMLSGANLLQQDMTYRNFFRRRFMRVGIPFLFWSLFYWLLMHPTIGIKKFWILLLQGQMNPHMWFFSPLFCIYFSMPFVRIFIKNATRHDIECYLLFSLALTSFMPFLYGSLEWYFPGYIFPLANQYLFMAVAGYYLNTYDIKWSSKTVLCIYGAAALFHFGYLFVKTQVLGHSDELILHYETPTIVIMSACIFVLFSRMTFQPSEIGVRRIEKVAGCSLGVYLVHNIFITYIPVYAPILKNCYWDFVVVYTASLLITMLIKKIPLLRKCV